MLELDIKIHTLVYMNPTTEFITELKTKLPVLVVDGARFIALTYTSKSTGEVAVHTVNVGISYENCVKKSKEILESLVPSLNGIDVQAAQDLLGSLEDSLEKMKRGLSNERYTKQGIYESVVPGLKVNTNDQTLEIQGLQVKKHVIVPGIEKQTKSSPLTIAKNKLRKMLPIGNFRTFALDRGAIDSIRIAGTELIA